MSYSASKLKLIIQLKKMLILNKNIVNNIEDI